MTAKRGFRRSAPFRHLCLKEVKRRRSKARNGYVVAPLSRQNELPEIWPKLAWYAQSLARLKEPNSQPITGACFQHLSRIITVFRNFVIEEKAFGRQASWQVFPLAPS